MQHSCSLALLCFCFASAVRCCALLCAAVVSLFALHILYSAVSSDLQECVACLQCPLARVAEQPSQLADISPLRLSLQILPACDSHVPYTPTQSTLMPTHLQFVLQRCHAYTPEQNLILASNKHMNGKSESLLWCGRCGGQCV